MKTLFRTLLGLAAVLPVLSSCQGLFSEGQGIIRISFQQGRLTPTRASESVPEPDDFLLTVTGAGGDIIYEGRFGDSPEELTVSPGNYTISAVSEEFDGPEYDKAVFGDTRWAKKRYTATVIAVRATAEGRREVNSVTCPTGNENNAISQWNNGGL